jgi:deaminated glutathione amidase
MSGPAATDQIMVAAVQLTSGTDVSENLECSAELISRAAADGAQLVVLPENFGFLGLQDAERLAHAEPDDGGPMQQFLARVARDEGVWIVGGTLPIRVSDDRAYSSCLVYDAAGMRRARYDKIHLFDVALPDRDEQYRESERTTAGSEAVVVSTPWGGLGLSVCYDVRFPELYRQLAGPDLSMIALPSAFTAATGRAHWEVLVRARAIENLCPVIAACQGGRHPSGRETWGHSMIVDAWGEVLVELEQSPELAVARLDLARMRVLRQQFPVLDHRSL